MATMLEMFEAARRVSVPLVAVRTADQAAVVAEVAEKYADAAIVQWDAARGFTGVGKHGADMLTQLKVKAEGFTDSMVTAQKFEKGCIVLVHNAMRQLHSSEPMSAAAAVQAVANLRDRFKQDHRMLVLLGPGFVSPPEMEQDVVVLDHALPGAAELERIVRELHESSKRLKQPDKKTMAKAVDSLRGLSAFAAEQVVAMSLTPDGMDLDRLWERKRVAIEQTRGLSVWRGGERFRDLVGLGNIKEHLLRRLNSRTPVGIVVFLDEIDKVFANVEGDTSGVRTDQLRTMLTEMENNEWRGLVAVGVAGGGKSALAKAFGNEAGVPTIAIDLGAMESKFVGESEAALRQAMAIVKAVGGGNAYFIATSNNASVMRPELQRRFTDGMWFFDVMGEDERAACWAHYMAKYELKAQPLPPDSGWTGAEVRNCCRYAWDAQCSLLEASKFVLPMSQSRAPEIDALRQYAHGRFLDASRPGAYRYEPERTETQRRAVDLSGAGKVH